MTDLVTAEPVILDGRAAPTPGFSARARAIATLTPRTLSVLPGESASCELRIKNAGSIVDQLSVDVLGAASAWATVQPPAITLMPGSDDVVTVKFAPPRNSDSTAGANPFGLRVVSSANPADTIVEEGTISVGVFADHSAELIPGTIAGARSAHTDLAFDNHGNARINAGLVGADPDAALAFAFTPPALVVEPGTASFIEVAVRPRKRFLFGIPKSHPYQVQALPKGAPPVIADGTYIQTAMVPKWLPKALALLVAAALVLTVLWFALLKPTIQSTAKDAAAAAAQAAIAQQAKATTPAPPAAPAKQPAPPAASPTPVVAAGNPLGDPISMPFAITAAPGQAPVGHSYSVPGAATLSVTDIVFENPQGDTGTLQIVRDGQPLLAVQLANFRDLDYHFVSPLTYAGGKSLTVLVTCQAAGATGTPVPTKCNDSVFFSGFQK